MAVGGGPVQDVIDEFYATVGRLWGADEMQNARISTHRNADYATEWLAAAAAAGGGMAAVAEGMGRALVAYRNHSGGSVPGSLGAINRSAPDHIRKAISGAKTTSNTSYTIAGTKPDADVEQPYMPIRIIARRNGWDDVADRIKALSDENVEAANAYALSMEAQVQTKKERAAA